jgi:hypothetical protein
MFWFTSSKSQSLLFGVSAPSYSDIGLPYQTMARGRQTGSGSVGATFQLAAQGGVWSRVRRHEKLTPISPSDVTEATSAARRDRWSRRTVGLMRHIGSEAMMPLTGGAEAGAAASNPPRKARLETHSDDTGNRPHATGSRSPSEPQTLVANPLGVDLPIPQKPMAATAR